jgi:hypothetical protein
MRMLICLGFLSVFVLASHAREPYQFRSGYSSSSIKNQYGKTIGRRETIKNSAAKYENYYQNGKKTASVRTPNTGSLSKPSTRSRTK